MAVAASSTEWRRFLLFVAVGVINTCFGYAAFAFFLWLGVGNDMSVLFGMIAGIIFNYSTIGAVFSARGISRLPHFLVTYLVLLTVNVFALRYLVALGVSPYLGEAIIVATVTPISFFLMRRFVFVAAPELHP
jgi:putative flippase GtrA